MFCVSLPARTWLKNPTRPIGRWKHEQMFETIVWSCFCPIISALYHKIHPLNKKRTRNHCNFRHETWAHPLLKTLEKQWMNVCLYESKSNSEIKVYILRSFRFPNFGHVWLNRFWSFRKTCHHAPSDWTSYFSTAWGQKTYFRFAFRVDALWT